MYPPDPGEKSATVGGNVMTNAGGMRGCEIRRHPRLCARDDNSPFQMEKYQSLGARWRKTAQGMILKTS